MRKIIDFANNQEGLDEKEEFYINTQKNIDIYYET